MRPNVPMCVFILSVLDDLSLPDHSTIDDKNSNSMFDDTYNGSVSCTMHKQYLYSLEVPPDSMTNNTITCEDTDDVSVGNV